MMKRTSRTDPKAKAKAKRELVTLKAKLGMTSREIADALGTPKRTIEGWLSLHPERKPHPAALIVLRMLAERRGGNRKAKRKVKR
jgi:DNA-binding transcriptional regulator YiaG